MNVLINSHVTKLLNFSNNIVLANFAQFGQGNYQLTL